MHPEETPLIQRLAVVIFCAFLTVLAMAAAYRALH